MIANARARISASLGQRVFYGWPMVVVATLLMFSSGPGQSHTFAVFNALIAEDLGLTLFDVALAYGIATAVAAFFLLPQFGKMLERFGPRRALSVSVVLLGFGCLFFGAVANLLWLAVGFGLVRFLGQGCLMMGAANLTAQWFVARRGFAMGIVATGFALSIAAHPALSQLLIDWYGWRNAWVALGAITWLTMLPVLLLVVRDRPENMGLMPDGAPAEGGPAPELTGATRAEALRSRSFWICATGLFLIAGGATTLHYHQVNILVAQGLTEAQAAEGFGWVGLAMLIFMPLVGRGFDRLRTRYMFAAALCVQASTLMGVTLVDSYPALIVYAVAFGLNNAFSITMMGYIWPRYFGRKHLGSIQGTGQMIGVIGASVGALPVALALDGLSDPGAVLGWLAALPIACAGVAVFFLKTLPQVAIPHIWSRQQGLPGHRLVRYTFPKGCDSRPLGKGFVCINELAG